MNFLLRILGFKDKDDLSLDELIQRNSDEDKLGTFRALILNRLQCELLYVGYMGELPENLHQNFRPHFIISTAPNRKEYALMAFTTESKLRDRNHVAVPYQLRFHEIKRILDSPDLCGLVVNADGGWLYFEKDEVLN
ncbi:MAG TPA: hypothetical protein VK174_04835 [Chitinophagales bacterium]|nr:hypothetical protein [Chitinophagales bacterium]